MGVAFLDDTEGVVASEVDEPFAWDNFKVMGFADQPLASIGICDELALVDRRVDAVLAHVDQP